VFVPTQLETLHEGAPNQDRRVQIKINELGWKTQQSTKSKNADDRLSEKSVY
jgi:hypothetical protein